MSQDYIPEKDLSNQAKAISFEEMEILCELMKTHICKIECKDGAHGTGYFSNLSIDDWNCIKVLMTNNHVLGENDLIVGNTIHFSVRNNSENYEIKIDESRKKYTSEKYDITIIEIKSDDGLKKDSFFDIDKQIFNDINEYNKKQIYLLHYPKGMGMYYSAGIIKNISLDNYTIEHLCNSSEGSSGGPLINAINYKVIGVHKGGAKGAKNYNLGTMLNEVIIQFREKVYNDNEKKIIK